VFIKGIPGSRGVILFTGWLGCVIVAGVRRAFGGRS